MASIDMYKNTMMKKREEIAKLNKDLAKEQEKIANCQKKIENAESTIRRTKNEATIKSKKRDIENAKKSILEPQKRCVDIQKKIAQKEKEYATAERNYRNEELKNAQKIADGEKKRQRDLHKQTDEFTRSLQQQKEDQMLMMEEIKQLKTLPKKITVLFLASNPMDTNRLKLDEEARAIQKKIREAEYRDSISLETRWAVRSSDILQAINETNPTIIHFSGHGSDTGELVLMNSDGNVKLVSKESVTMAMSTASDTIRLVIFNTCFSAEQASDVVKYIEAAIGMSESINDEAACVFSAQLYSSIGFGRSLKTSFDQAKAALMLENIQGENIPELYVREGIVPKDIVFVEHR